MPYPAETEIIANVVTSPHHLSATMVTGRVHRMTRIVWAAGAGGDARSGAGGTDVGTRHDGEGSSRSVFGEGGLPDSSAVLLRDQITLAGQDGAAGADGGVGAGVYHRVFERGESDSGADRAARRGAGGPRGAGSANGGAAADVAGGKSAAVRGGSGAGRPERAGRWWRCWRAMRRAFRCGRWI